MNNKKILALAFLFIAALSLIFSIVCFSMDTSRGNGSTEMNETYGGDAYTGIQNAAAQGATNTYYVNRNVQALAKCVKTAAGFAFIITAFTFAAIGVVNLMGEKIGSKIPAQFSNAFEPTPAPVPAAGGFAPMPEAGFAPMPNGDFAPVAPEVPVAPEAAVQ